MFIGMITFVCNDCGRKFEGMDIIGRWMGTFVSVPQKCPGCGSYHTMPDGFLGFRKKMVYRFIWKLDDGIHKMTEFTKSINSNS